MALSDETHRSVRPGTGSGRYRIVDTSGQGRNALSSSGGAGPLAGAEKSVRLDQDWAEAIFNLNRQTGLSEATLLDVTLDEVVRLSRSEVGYCHLIDPDQKTIRITACSKVIRARRQAADLPPHCSLDEAGIWADCVRLGRPVIHNAYPEPENRADYPTGHYPLARHASVPVYDAGKIVAILGVGNKTDPYDETDVARLSLVGCNLWVVLKHRKSEQALRTSEEKFRHFVEQSGDGIVLVDDRGVVVEWNQSRVHSTGIPREEALGQPVWIVHSWLTPFVDPWEADEWIELTRKQILDALQTGNVGWLGKRFNWEVIHRDGTRRILEITVFPIETGRGRMLGSVSRDITERRKTWEELGHLREHFEELVEQRTAELKSVNEQLEAISHVKDEFVSNVSHELRTPITSLKLHQHLLRQHPEELIERLDIMGRETDRLASTIEQLLHLSRLDQGRTELRLVEVDLNRMMNKTVSDRAPLSQHVTLGFKAAPRLPHVIGDASLLGEVLEILLSNALKYTPAGGRITVGTCVRGSDRLQVAGFSVSDTGPGIDPAEQPLLFDRFFRGKAGRESASAGSGLGLAIAREIVERHSGQIEVVSAGVPGEGASFTVWLPAREK